MYDKKFIFEECGFDFVPGYINRDLLFNVSYDIHTGEIKLYILNNEKTYLYKISKDHITKQFDAVQVGAETSRLSEYLETEFDYTDLLLDTVEQDTYYVYVEETSLQEYMKFMSAIRRKFEIVESELTGIINRINKNQIANLREGHRRRSVSLVKVPFMNSRCKLYARPFKTGNQFDLTENALRFLARLYGCQMTAVSQYIKYLWVSSELFEDRIVVTTQHHSLYHR